MPKPRYRLVDTSTTPYYHCVSRCVRRAFLCGDDSYTGKNFDHRKQWVVDRVRQLSSILAIDVCAYAIMSNHFHLVVHVDVNRAKKWSKQEVMERWLALYSGPDLIHRYKAGESLSSGEQSVVDDMLALWRTRLADLSWYMRCLNETIARMANFEDNCTGRFWEGRFRSQALLDEAALVACMAYVDLNPVRAGLSQSLLDSDFTSIQERLREITPNINREDENKPVEDRNWLQPFVNERKNQVAGEQKEQVKLPLNRDSYLALVDWTGRVACRDKKGAIPDHVPTLLESLGIEQPHWVGHVKKAGRTGVRASGQPKLLRIFALKHTQKWLSGQSAAEFFYKR